jgi:hypothetical protein
MTLAQSALHPEHEIEGLLTALNGVLAARVALSPQGRVEEVHVLSDPSMHPKQMVRNIESALSAGLGIMVDRRAISVAQVRADDGDAYVPDQADARAEDVHAADAPHDDGSADGHAEATSPAGPDSPHAPRTADPQATEAAQPAAATSPAEAAQPAAAARPAEAAPAADAGHAPEPGTGSDAAVGRFIFTGYDARTQPDRETACRVTLRRDDDVFSGKGSGPSTPLGRAQSAAHAVFGAIAAARRSQSLGLEGVTLVESHGRGYVLVAAHAVHGRSTVPLTGIAALHRSPEEAAILASLQAINRWNEFDD